MSTPLTIRRRIVGVVGVLVVGAAVGFATLGATSVSPEDSAVRTATRSAITDAMDAGTFKDATWTTGRLPAEAIASMHSVVDEALAKHMTGRALSHWTTKLHEAIDRDSDGKHVVVTAGGVDQIQFKTSTVDGDTATATGRVHVWAKWVIHDSSLAGPKSGRPAEWDRFIASLVRVDGSWKVSRLSLAPEAGG